jgi:IstB-like ATP binding protein
VFLTFDGLRKAKVRDRDTRIEITPKGANAARYGDCSTSGVRYVVAADLIETLYRGLADNSVGKVIGGLLRHELILIDELGFAPLDDTGSQLLYCVAPAPSSNWRRTPRRSPSTARASPPSTPSSISAVNNRTPGSS